MDSNLYSSDKEVHYVSSDELIEAGILTAQSDQSKPLQGLSKKPVKPILRCRIEKENNYIALKNLGFSK